MSSGGGAIRTLQCQGSNKLDNVEGDGSEISQKKIIYLAILFQLNYS